LGAIVFLLVGFCLATGAQAADDTAPDIDQATAWVFYQSEMSAFSQPSSTNIQLLEDYFELVSYALDKNPAKSKEIMEEVLSRTEIQAAIDNPEWLHGIDIVVDGGRSEAPSDFELDQKRVVDHSDIWIVGWDGLILHSGDDGLSWDVQDADIKSHLQAVAFVDRGFGVAVGHNGTIVRTTDGGQSWNSSSAAGGADLFAVDCLNREQCVAVGDFSGIIETDNGGQSWSEVKPAPFEKVAAIKMISHEIRLVAGTEIWRTIDGGESWSKVFPVGFIESLLWTGSFSSLAVADIQTIWAVGRDGAGIGIYRSLDGGESWSSQADNIDPDLHFEFDDPRQAATHRATAVHALNADRAYVAATNGVILATVDGGEHWWVQLATGQSTTSLHGLAMRDARVGWAIGNLGQVLATNSGGWTWVPQRGHAYLAARFASEALGLALGAAKKDDSAALENRKPFAEQGDAIEQFRRGLMYRKGQGVPQDYAEAVKSYRLAAEQGHAAAQNHLGIMYMRGEGVSQDYQEAAKWYRLAAEQGSADAQFNLANLYQDGNGVPQDHAEAVKWYRLSAEQGEAAAQNNLGLMYSEGEGVPQDSAQAANWYRIAASQGHANAQFNLGLAYKNGKGVPQDDTEAVKWYRLAAEQGHPPAQFNLGYMYDAGKGVPQDYAEAVKWYRLSAEQGYANAQNNLGLKYERGNGVKKDNVYAYMWWEIAASQGNEVARANRDEVAARMTRAEIAKAQAMALECVAKDFKDC
jgi:TPR repeat protein/photosystem II stability/assembly factor-like uncharacterized protein